MVNSAFVRICLANFGVSSQIPKDGPAGKLLDLLDRHNFRPAHIHLVVRHSGYKDLTTQIFDQDCKYLENDSVFAVKDDLMVKFVARKDDPQASLELEYNISLASSPKALRNGVH